MPPRPLPRPPPRLEDDSGMFRSKSVRAAERLPLPIPEDPAEMTVVSDDGILTQLLIL